MRNLCVSKLCVDKLCMEEEAAEAEEAEAEETGAHNQKQKSNALLLGTRARLPLLNESELLAMSILYYFVQFQP